MTESVGLIIAVFCLGLVPPFRWGMRLIFLVLIVAGFVVLLEPQTTDPGLFDGMMRAVITVLILAVLIGVAVRGAIDRGRGVTTFGGAGLAKADGALMGIGGTVVGCALFWMLAVWLQEASGGLGLHLGVAVIAMLASIGLARGLLRWGVFGAGLTIAVLALDGGLRYPDLIASQATLRSGGLAYCLMLGRDLSTPRRGADLMALTLKKTEAGPSAVILLVESTAGKAIFRWSFRARRFVPTPWGVDFHAAKICTPALVSNLPD